MRLRVVTTAAQLCVVLMAVSTTATDPPPEWAPRIAAGNMLWSPDPTGLAANHFPVLGNGFIGWLFGQTTMNVAGVFNGYLTKDPSHRARFQSYMDVQLPQAVGKGPRALDVEQATFYARDSFPVDGVTFHTERRFYIHRKYMSLAVVDVRVWTDAGSAWTPVNVSFVQSLGDPSKDLQLNPIACSLNTPGACLNGSTVVSETNTSGLTGVAVASSTIPSQQLFSTNNSMATFITAFTTSNQMPVASMASAAAKALNDGMAGAAAGTLWDEHVQEWQDEIWASGIEFVGSASTDATPGNALYLAQAVNVSMFTLFAAVREDVPYGFSPGGLTDGYNGHSFWDTARWAYPPYLILQPALGQALMEYRFNRIPGAREKAKSYNPPYNGTMFPWESAFTGEETCPSWAATGQLEQHISGDIAVAVHQYWMATMDQQWLASVGFPLLEGIADFWTSRVQKGTDGLLHINHVIPPDEYHTGNDSAFTNVVAILSLQHAVNAAKLLGKVPASYAQWQATADNIFVPFDPELKYHPEYDSYTRGTKIKQADVILLGYPLEITFANMTPEVRKNDLDYYATVTDPNGPAMTWGMQSVGMLETGDVAGAAKYFNQSFANQQQPFMVWTETPQGGTSNFATGAGGFLQGVLGGYPGLRLRSTGLFLSPRLYENTRAVKLRAIGYLGQRLDISYDDTQLTVEVLAGGSVTVKGRVHDSHALSITDESTGKATPLTPGTPVTFTITPSGFLISHSMSDCGCGFDVVAENVVASPAVVVAMQ